MPIMDLVAASGTGFAFPSQTVYTGQDLRLDAERSRLAEAQVRSLREENTRALDEGNSS